MLGLFILIGIIVGFVIGTYYLYQYWSQNSNERDGFYKEMVNKPESSLNIDKDLYELAYQKNTKFNKEKKEETYQKENKEQENRELEIENKNDEQEIEQNFREVHEIYAFHPIPTPKTKSETGREGLNHKEEIDDISYNNNPDENQFENKKVKSFGEQGSEIGLKEDCGYESLEKENKGGMGMTDLQQVNGLELIKTPVVIGENVVQIMEVTDLPLDMTAIKVRDITAKIVELDTEVIEDKVIIQGVLHKQIFYVGTDNIIHHQSEDINFSTFVDIPEAEPGMDVLVDPTVEHIVSQLIMDGTVLHQKVVLQFFVKVLSKQQLIVETGSGPLVKVERVIGENAIQTMVDNEVTLAVAAEKIVDIDAEVIDLTADVISDKIIIQGVIHKQLFYIGEDDVEHHQAEEIPFSEFIDLPGAEPGMNVQVHPTIEHVKHELTPDGTVVNQEIVLELFAKVTETSQIKIATGEDSLVMLPEVIGENTKQVLSETTLILDQVAIKIKDIDAEVTDLNAVVIENKVIVQGIIHKQIFFVGEDNVEYHQQENVPFSTFVEVKGAKPDMNVDVIPEIAHIKPVLNTAGDLLTQKVIVDLFVKVTEDIQFNVNEVGPYGI